MKRDELGPNAGLVDEMYRLYRENPNAVSPGWRDFFADYQPRADIVSEVAPAPPPAPQGHPPKKEGPQAPKPLTLDG